MPPPTPTAAYDRGGPHEDRLVHRPPTALRPHPVYQELCGPIAAARVRRVAQQAGPIREPLLTTTDGTILDGHARWQVATDRHQPTLPCIEYDVTEDVALRLVVQRHRRASCASRQMPDTRCGLRPPGAGAAGKAPTTAVGNLVAEELRDRPSPRRRWPANALGTSVVPCANSRQSADCAGSRRELTRRLRRSQRHSIKRSLDCLLADRSGFELLRWI